MESIENDEPPSATKEELEEMIEERQRTLEEWYERSLVDTSTFDAESRRQIQEVVDESEGVYGSEGDIREFFERAVEAFGGEFEKRGTNLYQAELPDGINSPGQDATFGPFTFDRDFAMDHEDITYLAPDTDVPQRLMARVLEDERGRGRTQTASVRRHTGDHLQLSRGVRGRYRRRDSRGDHPRLRRCCARGRPAGARRTCRRG